MKTKSKKSLASTCLAAVVLIGGVTMTFQGLTTVAVAAEAQTVREVPTQYAAVEIKNLSATPLPPGYQKADYTIVDGGTNKPAANGISRDDAAETGAKALWVSFAIDLSGKQIVMIYNPADKYNRANWMGHTKDMDYYFYIDALTGEIASVQQVRTLKGTVNTGFDLSLEQNPQEYIRLATETAKEMNLVGGDVSGASYKGQGSTNNDPTISILVTGKNGERAILEFSRHDKALLTVSYERGVQTMEATEQAAVDFGKRAEEYFLANPDAEHYEE